MEESEFIPIWLAFLLLVQSAAPATAAENSVQVKFIEHQKITSSTLKWVTPSTPGSVPEEAVVGSVEYVPANGLTENDLRQSNVIDKSQIKERKIYICRTLVNGNWIPGALYQNSTDRSVCVVPLMMHRHEKTKYEVLVNVERGARLLWMNWEKHIAIPKGAVSGGDYFVAHTACPSFRPLNQNVALGMSHLIGTVDPKEGIFGKMIVVNEDGSVDPSVSGGQILVEVEPVLYELTIRKLLTSRQKIVTKNTTILGETILRNDVEDTNEMKVDSVIPYTWRYYSNWGPGKAMLKGLPTTIYMWNSSLVENITWGIPLDEQRDGIEKVEARLPAGTATFTQLQAEYMEIEVTYIATLLSVFDDNTMMNRTLHGIHKYSTLTDIKPIYGPLYFIQNNTLVPTTTTTTTEEPPTTTTISTTSTTSMANEITKSTSGGTTAEDHHGTIMYGDDGGAMQLNKRDHEHHNGTNSANLQYSPPNGPLFCSVAIALIPGYVVNRIT